MHDYYQCFTTYSFHRSRSTTTKCNRGIQQTTMWKQGFYPWESNAVLLWVSLFEAIHALPLNVKPLIAIHSGNNYLIHALFHWFPDNKKKKELFEDI